MPVAEIASLVTATLWKATVILLSDKREGNAYPHSFPRHIERTFGQPSIPDSACLYGAGPNLISNQSYYNMRTFIRQAILGDIA